MSPIILYVEDNARNLRLVRKLLAIGGYDMIEAVDGLSGVEIARQQRPDLILMDINLPDIDGVEAAARIHAIPEMANTPIIALTANAMHGDRERFIAAGCNGYIAKPITKNELLNTVARFLADIKSQSLEVSGAA